ncbi:hypothetical protein M1446_00575 [Candidatus Dependentiae bacterium]|nr:hypothetical protein [Candidatus Dependentiae bacterium]
MLILILELFLILFSPIKAAQLIQGDNKNSIQSFSFPIGLNKIYRPTGMLVVAAQQAVPENIYSIAISGINNNDFLGITPLKVKLNNVDEQSNPLNGAQINLMSLLGMMPVVVKEGDGSSIYINQLQMNSNIPIVTSAQNIHDASGISNTAKIVGLQTSQPGTDNPSIGSIVFAAVQSAAGNFGTGDSGIIFLIFQKTSTKVTENGQEKIVDSFSFNIFDAQNGIANGNRAVQLNVSTPAVKINGDLTNITNQIVDMHWDENLSRLYIALQGQAGPGATDGIRAVVMAYIQNNQLILSPIAPDSAIAGTNQIIAAQGALTSVSIDKVRTMSTSTYLKYLIVTTANQVFALPLVNNGGNFLGTIADKTQTAKSVFNNTGTQAFTARILISPATTPSGMPNNTDIAAQIGQGPLPANVQDIFISGDSVYVAISNSGNAQEPGIFYSQAIFGPDGSIVNWTKWVRTYTQGRSIFGINQDINSTKAWYLTGSSQFATSAVNVERTAWNTGDAGISTVLQQQFPKEIAGIQGVFDFPFDTDSFSTTIGNRISINVFTGYKKVLLLQNGSDTNNLFGPEPNFGNVIFSSTNGTLEGLTASSNITGISISGGALNDIGPIIAAEILSDGNFGWLVVGGIGGIAILSDENGNGWNATTGLQKGFIGLNNNFSFKKVGNFANVRKLISRNNLLYVLSNNSVDRFTASATNFQNNNLNSVQLAAPQNIQGFQNTYFSDLIVKNNIALLGTSNGLLRTGPSVTPDAINDINSAQWMFVNLQESVGPITRLFDISLNKKSADPTNIYILNAYVGFQQARIYRGYLNGPVFMSLPDQFTSKVTTFLLNIGKYRNYVSTDGANLYVSRSRFTNTAPIFEFYKLPNLSGSSFAARTNVPVTLGIDDFKSLTQLVRNSANGSFMIGGDFGLRVHN